MYYTYILKSLSSKRYD